MHPRNPLQAVKAIGRYLSIPFFRARPKGNPPAFFFGFSPWKTFIRQWFPEREIRQAGTKLSAFTFYTQWAPWILRDPRSEIFIWSFIAPAFLERFAKRFNVPLRRMEDGFVRSIALGATHVPPASIVTDSRTLHFDASRPSDLEVLLQTYDFDADPALMARARHCIDLLLQQRISKYNTADQAEIETVYGPKERKRILVIGQVEDDQSIAYGCDRPIDNNRLVMLARRENPDADIIYKPHPQVLLGVSKALSDPAAVAGICTVLVDDIPLADSFQTIDHVYTITSLAGFEALLRGIDVTTFGCPFYSGWGVTDDRQPNPRRTRKLTVEQIFAASYLLYPKYLDPLTSEHTTLERVIEALALMKRASGTLPPSVKAQDVTFDHLLSDLIGKEIQKALQARK